MMNHTLNLFQGLLLNIDDLADEPWTLKQVQGVSLLKLGQSN